MNVGRWTRRLAIGFFTLAAIAAALAILGATMGLFSGKRPDTLGYTATGFAPGDWKPNWVSSTAPKDDAKHAIAPFAFKGDPAAAWSKLRALVAARKGATLVRDEPAYMHVEFASATMGFVDDAQFALDAPAGVIHVKSGARLGVRDFNVNRERVESLRSAFGG